MQRFGQPRLLALVSVSVALVVACDADPPGTTHACTLLACNDGLTVALTASSWSVGAYVFDLTGDAKTLHCEGELPLPACDRPGLTCTGDLAAVIAVGGCALPSGQQSFGPITLREGPAHVTIAITRDGSSIATGTFEPTYATSRPNGPTCEPVCRSAGVELVVSR